MSLINHTVIMSSARYFSNEQQINPYYHDEPVDINRAVAEHDQLRLTMEQAGITGQFSVANLHT